MLKQIVLYCFFSSLVLLLSPRVAFAATLQFDPKSLSCSVGGTCKVDVVVDAGTDEILATDARITFDKTILSVDSVSDGTYLTVGKKDCTSKEGECYFAGLVDDPADSKTGSGVLATITFKGKTNGVTTLAFVCKPGETATDSNIAKNDLNATDIIQCSLNGSTAVRVGAGSATTSTSTSTSTTGGGTGGGSTNSTSTLPKTGIMDEMIKWAVPGGILVLIGAGALLFL